MSKIPDFAYIDLPNAVHIVHTKEPLIIGRVWMYKDYAELRMQIGKIKPTAYAEMTTHSIGISFWAILGDRFLATPQTLNKFDEVMIKMVAFFEETRVKKSPKYYDKFKK